MAGEVGVVDKVVSVNDERQAVGEPHVTQVASLESGQSWGRHFRKRTVSACEVGETEADTCGEKQNKTIKYCMNE